jgi:hypothetical protein
VKRTKLGNLKQALTFLELKGLDHIDFRVEWTRYGVDLKITPDRMTEKDARDCKRVFGPLEYENQYGKTGKNARGKHIVDDECTINYTLNQAMSCEDMDLKDKTEEEIDEILYRVKKGEVTVIDCKPVDFMEEKDREQEETPF